MRFRTIRNNLAPSLLLCAAGCGAVSSEPVDATPTESDAAADAAPADASVDAPVDAAPIGELPVNTVTAGTVAEGGTLSLQTGLITADADDAAVDLVYTVRSLPADGNLQLSGANLAVGGTFTQQDVNGNLLRYVHRGAENAADAFTWTLSDGDNTIPGTGAASFAVTVTPVNDVPAIANNPVTSVAEGATVVIDTAKLLATDPDSATLTYTVVTVPTRGRLEKRPSPAGAFTPLAANGTFTQQDITDGNVRFVDPGTDDGGLQNQQNTTSSFSWRVADGNGGVNPASGANQTNFTVTSVDDAPVISWRANACHVTNANVNANPVVSLSDPDNTSGQYSICVVSIGNATSIVFNTTTTVGTTVTFAPTLKNGAATLGVESCVVANALGALTLTSTGTEHGGTVTWKLMKAGVQFGAVHTEDFPKTRPPCP
jgi:hypothetical protein